MKESLPTWQAYQAHMWTVMMRFPKSTILLQPTHHADPKYRSAPVVTTAILLISQDVPSDTVRIHVQHSTVTSTPLTHHLFREIIPAQHPRSAGTDPRVPTYPLRSQMGQTVQRSSGRINLDGTWSRGTQVEIQRVRGRGIFGA